MDSRPDAAEEVHQIHGTGISFFAKPDELDDKAARELHKIMEKGQTWLDDVQNNAFQKDLEDLPKGFFLSDGTSYWKHLANNHRNRQDAKWRSHGSSFGYGIGHYASGYECFKRTYVYHRGNHRTNWIMVVYKLIHENAYIMAEDVVLCHVFYSDSYDPLPKHVPVLSDYDLPFLELRTTELERFMRNPNAFKDFNEVNGTYSKCDSKQKANGRKVKRADVWGQFTEIKVLGPDGEVMLTLAICHGCSMAYQTGKWDSKRGSLSNNGTKTLKEHYRKCRDQHHIAGNPQGAHHQRP